MDNRNIKIECFKNVDLNNIIKPKWLPIKYIEEGWNVLMDNERDEVNNRINKLFSNNDYINIKTNKIFYLHIFSFLAQVEVLAIQIPLKYMNSFDGEIYKKLRNQLIDEIVHGIIFTKIALELSLPLGYPTNIIESAESMCNTIRNIKDKNIALVALNLIAEGWIEEIFENLIDWGFSDNIFQSILDDEIRHCSDAEIYSKHKNIDKEKLKGVIEKIEYLLLESVNSPTIIRSFIEIGGVKKYEKMAMSLLKQHKKQLKILDLKPNKIWNNYLKINDIDFGFNKELLNYEELEMPFMNSNFIKMWKQPRDPTIRNFFDIHVDHIKNKNFFTSIFIYCLGKCFEKNNFNNCKILLNNNKLVKIKTVNIGLRALVNFDNNETEIGTINLYEIEKKGIIDIYCDIKRGLKLLKYWKLKRKEFEKTYKKKNYEILANSDDIHFSLHSLPTINSFTPVVISNLGPYGLDIVQGALTTLNSIDISIGSFSKKPVWNEKKEKFIPVSKSTICASSDHRIHSPGDFDVIHFINFFNNNNHDKQIKDELEGKDINKLIYNKKYNNYIIESNKNYNLIKENMSDLNIKRYLKVLSSYSNIY
jgi:hypothetical protein